MKTECATHVRKNANKLTAFKIKKIKVHPSIECKSKEKTLGDFPSETTKWTDSLNAEKAFLPFLKFYLKCFLFNLVSSAFAELGAGAAPRQVKLVKGVQSRNIMQPEVNSISSVDTAFFFSRHN
jgi:hypothetical protein